jgi:hypothetical protein
VEHLTGGNVTLTPEQKAEVERLVADAVKNTFTGDAFKGALSAALAPAIELSLIHI